MPEWWTWGDWLIVAILLLAYGWMFWHMLTKRR